MNIIIGNLISCGAAVFTALSSLSKGKKKIYGFQALQCLTMALASVFFASYTGVTTFLLCALRNYLLTTDRYTKKVCVFFLAAITILGLLSNNRGWIGLLPVITTMVYTVGQYYLRSEMSIKANIAVNLLLWAIYDIIISDYVSAVVDSITVVITGGAMIRLMAQHDRKK